MDPSWWNAMWSVSQCLSVLPGFELLVIGNLPCGTSSPKRCRRLSRFEATQKTSLANIEVESLKVMWMSKRCKCCLIVTGKSLSINIYIYIYLFYIMYIPLKIWDVHLKRDHFSKGSCHWSKHHFLRDICCRISRGSKSPQNKPSTQTAPSAPTPKVFDDVFSDFFRRGQPSNFFGLIIGMIVEMSEQIRAKFQYNLLLNI